MKQLADRAIFFLEDKHSEEKKHKVEVDIFRVQIKVKHDMFLLASSCYSIAFIESFLQQKIESGIITLETKKSVLDLIYTHSFLNEKAQFKKVNQPNQGLLF